MNNPNENDELRKQIELGKHLDDLQTHPGFIAVIKEGYIVNVLMNESQNMLDVNPVFRQEALEKIQSVNYLRQYFTELRNISDAASADFEQEA